MKAKKHILMTCGWYYPDSVGGTEAYVRSLSKELRALGWKITIAAPSQDEKEYDYTYEDIHVYRYPIALKPDRAEVRGETPQKYFERFTRMLERIKPDLLHIHSCTRALSLYHAQYAKEHLGIPLIVTIHAADFMCASGTAMRWGKIPCDGIISTHRCTACWINKYGVPLPLSWVLANVPNWISEYLGLKLNNKIGTALMMRRIFRSRNERLFNLLNLADKIVAVSQWIKEVLILNGVSKSKVVLCRHGLPYAITAAKRDDNGKKNNVLRIGYLGRFNWVKGIHILIKALKWLPPSLHIELKLYGHTNSPEEEQYLIKLKKMSSNDQRIIFCGTVDDTDRQTIMNAIDILAVPSIWFETGPLVVLEAFAAGIPVVGSNLGGLKELVADGINGMLVKPKNIAAWSKALIWLYEHQEVLTQWRNNIPPVRTSQDVALEMNNLYQTILDSSS